MHFCCAVYHAFFRQASIDSRTALEDVDTCLWLLGNAYNLRSLVGKLVQCRSIWYWVITYATHDIWQCNFSELPSIRNLGSTPDEVLPGIFDGGFDFMHTASHHRWKNRVISVF